MIRWIANVLFICIAVALAIFFLRIETVDGAVSIRVRSSAERSALWHSITGESAPAAHPGPAAEPDTGTQGPKPAPAARSEGTTVAPPARTSDKPDKPDKPAGKGKPVEKDLDREGLDQLIEKSL